MTIGITLFLYLTLFKNYYIVQIMTEILEKLASKIGRSLGIIQKKDIQITKKILDLQENSQIPVGDDCAAIPDGDGYLLLAAEGMWHVLIDVDPWFAGWCAVMVNISDIAAMGGKAIAVVDTIWTQEAIKAPPLLAGMKAASLAYNVPIVGGHTNLQSAYNALSVAILGKAKKLISSFAAQPQDLLVVAIDLRGVMHSKFPFWNAATDADPLSLQQSLLILPYLAENNLCHGGKDISMGGIIGTLLMLIEASRCGAILEIDRLFIPANVSLATWLMCFPSYGFLLSVNPAKVDRVIAQFEKHNIICAAVGEIVTGSQLTLKYQEATYLFWDWQQDKLMGFSQ